MNLDSTGILTFLKEKKIYDDSFHQLQKTKAFWMKRTTSLKLSVILDRILSTIITSEQRKNPIRH